MTQPARTVLTYDDLNAGRWYTVDGHKQNLYLRQKRRAGEYTFTRSDAPGDRDTIMIYDVRSILCIAGGPKQWFVATGDTGHDVDRLVTLLNDERDRRNSDEFTEWVQCSKVGGVRRAYQDGLEHYPTIEQFAAACERRTDWANDITPALEDIQHRQQLAKYQAALPVIPLLGVEEFRARVKELDLYEVGQGGVAQEYDQPNYHRNAGMWTDHMGPCITVGFTALSADGATRYNTLLHSFGDFTGANIIAALQGQFDGKSRHGQVAPAYATLKDVAYYVVGGSPDPHSSDKARQLLTVLRDDKLQVLGVRLTNQPTDIGLAKAVMITAEGKVYCTTYPANAQTASDRS